MVPGSRDKELRTTGGALLVLEAHAYRGVGQAIQFLNVATEALSYMELIYRLIYLDSDS